MTDLSDIVNQGKKSTLSNKKTAPTAQPQKVARTGRKSLQKAVPTEEVLKRLNVEIPQPLHADLQLLALKLNKSIKDLVTEELTALIAEAKDQEIID